MELNRILYVLCLNLHCLKWAAFRWMNRVKSELILRQGLRDDHFTTTNRIGAFNGMHNVAVVTLPVAATGTKGKQAVQCESGQQKRYTPPTTIEAKQEKHSSMEKREEFEIAERVETSSKSVSSRWNIGLNAGIPFFWGDMLSLSTDKSYIGFAVGVQGGYRFPDCWLCRFQ